MRYSIILAVSIFVFIPAFAFSATINIPADYPTIQQGIDAAVNGDTVLVAPGTYGENIDFNGKNITVVSAQGPIVTIIDGGNPIDPDYASVVTFRNGEGPGAVLDGFTVMNGTGSLYSVMPPENYRMGGGVFIKNASPIVKNNIITKNKDIQTSGGGLLVGENSSALIMNNVICCNSANSSGGGIVAYKTTQNMKIKYNRIYGNWAKANGGGVSFHQCSNGMVDGNSIYENQADGDYPPYLYYGGGGIFCAYTSPVIVNNYVAHNSCPMLAKGGGILCYDYSSPIIRNNFIGGNSGSSGGGLHSDNSSPTLSNNTFISNTAKINGGAITASENSKIEVIDSILWDNNAPTGPEIWVGFQYTGWHSTLTISYSDVKGGQASVFVPPGNTLNWGPGMIDANPLFVTGQHGFFYLSQDPCQPGINNPCVDTGSALASNLGMDIYWTRTDSVADSGIVDVGFHYGPDFIFPALQADIFNIPEVTGGVSNFLLLAGNSNANRNYLILGSISGTDPGTYFPGGQLFLPLNWDFFTNVVIEYMNSPIFSNFLGTLDGSGSAKAMFDTLGPIPGAAGLTMHFAFALNNPWDFASNPVGIEIVP